MSTNYYYKFHTVRMNGELVQYPTFTLRLDGSDQHSLKALLTYAESIRPINPQFADELQYIVQLASDNKNAVTVPSLKFALETRFGGVN